MAEPTEGEFDLNSLNDEELVEQVHDDLYNGLKVEVEEATRIFLKRGWSAERVLNDALVEGMRIVGIDFRDGILFVPEVLLAANSMKGGMEILRPLLAETGVEPIGKIVIGTVKGDIHDIGKNLVSMMLEGRASRSSISASTIRSTSISRRSRSTSPISSACRRCSPPRCLT
jgi:methanogenic corrinoid protein MtbC1